MTNQEKVQDLIDQNYSNNQLVKAFDSLVIKLNEGKWVNKDELLQTLIAYQGVNEKLINELAQIVVLTQVNYEVLKKVNEKHKFYYEEVSKASEAVNDFLTDNGFKQ